MRVIYGPIDSWRFGRSLGVDPLASRTKLCPFSCAYCQYGPTYQPTQRRRAFITVEQLRVAGDALGSVAADCVTFAGLGEPSLARNLPSLVKEIRRQLNLPIILLTGSSLMPRADVRQDALVFDQVVAKLDAPAETLFRRINRPMAGFPYELPTIVEGIRRFRRQYTGRLILQMMFLHSNVHLAPQMAELARSLEPDEIQLNTPLQPALAGHISAIQMNQVSEAFAGLETSCVYSNDQTQTVARFM